MSENKYFYVFTHGRSKSWEFFFFCLFFSTWLHFFLKAAWILVTAVIKMVLPQYAEVVNHKLAVRYFVERLQNGEFTSLIVFPVTPSRFWLELQHLKWQLKDFPELSEVSLNVGIWRLDRPDRFGRFRFSGVATARGGGVCQRDSLATEEARRGLRWGRRPWLRTLLPERPSS